MGHGQGHFAKMGFSNCWIPTSAVTMIWYEYGHQDQGHFGVKVIPESNGMCSNFYLEAASGPSTDSILVISAIKVMPAIVPSHYVRVWPCEKFHVFVINNNNIHNIML